MTAPLFTWLVWQDRAPLQSPKELGTVQAPTKADAELEAKKLFPGVPVLVQSAASATIKPFSDHPTTDAPLASETTRANYRHPRKHKTLSRSKQLQLQFNQAKRAAHAQRKASGDAMNPQTRTQA